MSFESFIYDVVEFNLFVLSFTPGLPKSLIPPDYFSLCRHARGKHDEVALAPNRSGLGGGRNCLDIYRTATVAIVRYYTQCIQFVCIPCPHLPTKDKGEQNKEAKVKHNCS